MPTLVKLAPQEKFDLIYIDGDHSYEGCRTDIENCRALAHKDTILWIDDCEGKHVKKAIKKCKKRRIIEVIQIHKSNDPHGSRSWAEARFLLS